MKRCELSVGQEGFGSFDSLVRDGKHIFDGGQLFFAHLRDGPSASVRFGLSLRL
jgi:hypothetical protein